MKISCNGRRIENCHKYELKLTRPLPVHESSIIFFIKRWSCLGLVKEDNETFGLVLVSPETSLILVSSCK